MCVALSVVSLCLWRLCCKLYIGALMKIAWVDPTEAVEGGTAARYGRALPVLVLTKASDAWLRGLFDLIVLETHKSLLICLTFPLESVKTCK
jgi:hypothetical protein